MFNPELFVIGGGIIQAGDIVLKPVFKYLKTRGLRPNRDVVKVVRAHFGPEAGMVGAACLVLDALGKE
jgi:glucokinase